MRRGFGARGFLALCLIASAGCPNTSNLCSKVRCGPGLFCDPTDGVCKAPTDGGSSATGCVPACAGASVCDDSSSPPRCVGCRSGLDCPSGTSCDLSTQTCVTTPGFDAGADGGPADGGASDGGDGGLSDAGCVPPPNDTCAGAAPLGLDGGIAVAAGDTRCATNDNAPNDSSPSCSVTARDDGPDVVYAFSLDAPQDVTVQVAAAPDSGYQPVAYLRTVCASGDAFEELACSAEGDFTAHHLDAGTYFLWVDGRYGTVGAFQLTVSLAPPAPAPANDTCAGAEALIFDGGTALAWGDTTAANNDNLPADVTPTCSSSARTTGHDVVYTFTLGAAQDVTLVVTPTGAQPSYEPVLYVRSPSGCASGALADELGCESALTSGPQALVLHDLAPGTYPLWVDGAEGTAGPFQLEVSLGPPTPPPGNDTCAAPGEIALDGGSADFAVDTSIYRDDYQGSCDTSLAPPPNGGEDAVYHLALAGPGTLSVFASAIDGGGADPVIYLRQSPCDAGSDLACSDQTGAGGSESFSAGLDAGDYYLFIDSFGPGGAGPMQVHVQLGP